MKSTPCATCGHELNLREADLDKTLLCPKCGRMQIVHLLETTLLGAGEPKVDAEPNEQIRGDVISPVNAHGARSSDFLEGGVSPLGADPHLPQPSSTGRFDFLAPPQMNGEIGRLGGYRVLQQLGAGGMGVVFRAEDPLLQREVALKVMLPWVASNPQSRDRFLREARAAARLEHENIISIYKIGEDRGVLFLAMPLLQGTPLARYQREHVGLPHQAIGPLGRTLPVAEVVEIGRQIAEGLAAAHERGLIHRDVKPDNIWLESRSLPVRHMSKSAAAPSQDAAASAAPIRVKILDFGLARSMQEVDQITQPGMVVGTPSYMAPEQARGEPIDGRSDLFSLGCVLYELSTGHRAFSGPNPMAILTSLAVDIPLPARELNPEVPPALSNLIQRLLEKLPGQRPSSARQVANLLSGFVPSTLEAPIHPHDSVMPHQIREVARTSVSVLGAPASDATVPISISMPVLSSRWFELKDYLLMALLCLLLVGIAVGWIGYSAGWWLPGPPPPPPPIPPHLLPPHLKKVPKEERPEFVPEFKPFKGEKGPKKGPPPKVPPPAARLNESRRVAAIEVILPHERRAMYARCQSS